MDDDIPTTCSSSKRKPTSSEAPDSPQPRDHKRLKTIEHEESPTKPRDSVANKYAASPEKTIPSYHEDEESEIESKASQPMDIDSEDQDNELPILNNSNVRRSATRTPILVPIDQEITSSERDDLYELYSDCNQISESEDDNPAAEESPARKRPSRVKRQYFRAMYYLDYYNKLTEEELRRAAIRWMEKESRRDPNGTAVFPPSWYLATRHDPPRPKVWIKDFFSGKVRPRQLVNDQLAEMTTAQREKWATEHGMGDSDDEDMETDAE
ncbi:hypothetical protein B0T20DRAFT_476399 [Sordaria brevicollis]|uniref:Uncharacterized protein n=1 Tax=Sordaria brevicollis TaxID=83679 RepID=A0AAE0PLX2_SORBR|nr:hypothetical protein B0T20DRAFT_476399 [Sordaria brevicollis]